jgi:hypothetical protein
MARDMSESSKEETAIETVNHSAEVESTSVTYPINMPDQEKPKGARPAKAAICHPHLPMYGAGPWCRKCKDLVRWQGERGRAKVLAEVEGNYAGSEDLKAEFVSAAKARLQAIREYAPRRKKAEDPDSKYVRTSNPRVAEHAAKVLILNALDGAAAAKEIKPDLSLADQAVLGRKLETDPHVHREVEKQLAPRGLSDHDRDYFVRRLWEMFDSTDPRQEAKSLGAMRILGKAFITEKVENTEIQSLRINGLEEGLARMTGEGDDGSAQSPDSSFAEVRSYAVEESDLDG